MDNNQNNNRGSAPNQGGKKPHHWHNHRRKPKNPAANGTQSPKTEHPGSDAISVRPGRYDTPPADAQRTEITVNPVSAENEAHSSGSRPHRPHHKRNNHSRGNNNHDNNTVSASGSIQESPSQQSESPDDTQSSTTPTHDHRRRNRNGRRHSRDNKNRAENAHTQNQPEADTDTAEDSPVQISEYITTAGSLDEEIIEELNSITDADAKLLAESDLISSSASEAELQKYEIVGIRFKSGGKIYYFDPNGMKLSYGDAVIVETSRGLEFGTCDIINRMATEREVVLPLRTVIRRATAEDIACHEANAAREKEALTVCSQKILEHKLGMKLIDVELAFDGSKLLFYFTAEGRIDFRELVKDLAAVFRTRIELRQIGIRDETKLLGGIGICGRPFCCKTFLSDFVQVSIKMAKEQNLSLNSAKISGACGRLMCCLRYEHDTYQEEIKKTPKVDQIVSTPDGDGTVIEVQPLAGLVRVRFGTKAEMLTPKVYHRDNVKVIGGKGVKPKETEQSE